MKKFDPIVIFLQFILRKFLSKKLSEENKAFIADNMRKHRLVLWLNLPISVLVFLSLLYTPPENVSTVIMALLAPVMVLGGAWFAISFGAVPAELLDAAMEITFWMFTAFVASLSAMFLAVGFVASPFLWPVLTLIYFAAIASCIQYDTADGLKAGLDQAVLTHARYAVAFYQKQGVAVDATSAPDHATTE